MNRTDWQKLIDSLPAGMTQVGASRHLKLPQGAVRHWIRKLNYRFKDGRRIAWSEARRKAMRKVDPATIDWTKPNVVIARETGISREGIRQMRNTLGIAKVNGRKRRKNEPSQLSSAS